MMIQDERAIRDHANQRIPRNRDREGGSAALSDVSARELNEPGRPRGEGPLRRGDAVGRDGDHGDVPEQVAEDRREE